MINEQIVEVANTGNIAALLETISLNLPDMNLVNLTTSLHRIAKICSECQQSRLQLGGEAQSRLMNELLVSIDGQLQRCGLELSDAHRHSLSNIVWSMGTLNCMLPQLLRTVVAIAFRQLGEFRPLDLVSTVWGLAALGAVHPGVRELTAPLHEPALARLVAVVGKLGYRFVVMAAWSAAAWGQRDAALFNVLGKRILPMLRHAQSSPKTLVEVAWAFGTMGSHPLVMAEVAWQSSRQMAHFSAVELVAICRLLPAEAANADFLAAAAARAQSLSLAPQQLMSVLGVLLRPGAGASALAAALPLLKQLAPSVGQLDLTSVAATAWTATNGLRSAGLLPGGSAGSQPALSQASVPLEFFSAVALSIMHSAKMLAGKPLAELTMTALAASAIMPPVVQSLLATQVVTHAGSIPPSTAVQLLASLHEDWQDSLAPATAALLTRLAAAVGQLGTAELQELRRTCGERLGGLIGASGAEVSDACLVLAQLRTFSPTAPAVKQAEGRATGKEVTSPCFTPKSRRGGKKGAFCRRTSTDTLDSVSDWSSATPSDAEEEPMDTVHSEPTPASPARAKRAALYLSNNGVLVGHCEARAMPAFRIAAGFVLRKTFLEVDDSESTDSDEALLELPVLEAVLRRLPLEEVQQVRRKFRDFGVW